MKIYKDVFNEIISLENLFLAWDKFKSDKQKKQDVQMFEWRLEENIFKIYMDLKYRRYKHGAYHSFYIYDPKQRHIHKAIVRDRILHHAVFNVLEPIFDPTFISNSFSCRFGKGTHKGVDCLTRMVRQVSRNYTNPCFALKCDISKFFASVDHQTLISIIGKKIRDDKAMCLIKEIIFSFNSNQSNLFNKRGLPIGNFTSQLFANIYLNEFDQFVKHKLKIDYYIRYTDDFIIIANNRLFLENVIISIQSFLTKNLFLKLHSNKIIIRKINQGIDFLGYVVLPYYRLIRFKTKQRIFRKIKKRIDEYKKGVISNQAVEQSLQSYLGVFSHANAYKIEQNLKNKFWFWLNE